MSDVCIGTDVRNYSFERCREGGGGGGAVVVAKTSKEGRAALLSLCHKPKSTRSSWRRGSYQHWRGEKATSI